MRYHCQVLRTVQVVPVIVLHVASDLPPLCSTQRCHYCSVSQVQQLEWWSAAVRDVVIILVVQTLDLPWALG